MISQASCQFLNHVLDGADWARERLRPHAGKRVRFEVPPLAVGLAVDESGRVAADQATAPELTVRLTHFLLPRLLLGDEAAFRQVETVGDTELAQEIDFLFRHLRWDAEEDLSRVFGDIAARRMAAGSRALARFPLQAADALARMAADYLQQEAPSLATRERVHAFNADVDRLRDDVERLEKRLGRLEKDR
ncbi:MAG TPA: SCP2 sterol-binding domain-containing protein [Pelomicrobium sp.]|nr:SCP2 sterol-binding domain-containing protein [Pelomicrobium sp.]